MHGDDIGQDCNGSTPALFLAWCVNLELFDRDFATQYASMVLRLKLRELDCLEFFTLAAAGELRKSCLNETGQHIADRWYVEFKGVVAEKFEREDHNVWDIYDQVAPWLTANFMRMRIKRRWWEFWVRD